MLAKVSEDLTTCLPVPEEDFFFGVDELLADPTFFFSVDEPLADPTFFFGVDEPLVEATLFFTGALLLFLVVVTEGSGAPPLRVDSSSLVLRPPEAEYEDTISGGAFCTLDAGPRLLLGAGSGGMSSEWPEV
ncbi:MAG: hypothetical protein JWO08_115 [Verrucomicrobiaceae bacterium]|nr:hypothetical protein [Verrucomicrobiaceae bacterium]